MSNLARVEIADSQLDTAREYLLKGLALFREIGDTVNVASCVTSLACLHAALRTAADARQAARLSGLADRLPRESGGTLEAADRLEAQRAEALARSMIEQDVFEAAWTAGQTPSFEQQLWESLSAVSAAKDKAPKLWYHAGR